MRLDIRYRLRFEYGSTVSESYNEVRVRPQDTDSQTVASYRLTASPAARPSSAVDYWGTTVSHVGIREAHEVLELVAEAAVDTSEVAAPSGDAELSMLEQLDFRTEHWEFLQPSDHVEWNDAIRELAVDAMEGSASVLEAVDAAAEAANQALQYRGGATEIGVGLTDLLAGGAGVCQDYAHLAIGFLRSQRIPARYVSGYLFTADETRADGPSSDVVSVQTHAWIEAAVPGVGWVGRDPTNGGRVGERHVVIGRARDYGDVPPVRGVFNGSAEAEVSAEVVIAKMDDVVPARALDPGPRRDRPINPAQQWQSQQ